MLRSEIYANIVFKVDCATEKLNLLIDWFSSWCATFGNIGSFRRLKLLVLTSFMKLMEV